MDIDSGLVIHGTIWKEASGKYSGTFESALLLGYLVPSFLTFSFFGGVEAG